MRSNRKALCCILAVMLFAAMLTSCSPASTVPDSSDARQQTVITATFYPIYIYLANLTQGIDGIAIECLTPPSGGCLHDYQLTTSDMKLLDKTDILVANGAGMEGFLQDITPQFPFVQVVDASDGYTLLESAGAPNPHLFVSPAGALYQLQTIQDALCAALPQHADALTANGQAYADDLRALQQEIAQKLSPHRGAKVAVLHCSFDYFMQEYGIDIVTTLMADEESDPTPEQLAGSIAAIRDQQAVALFKEPQYSDALCQTVQRETDIPLYSLDDVVTGEISAAKDAYLKGMRANLNVLLQAFGG